MQRRPVGVVGGEAVPDGAAGGDAGPLPALLHLRPRHDDSHQLHLREDPQGLMIPESSFR